MLLDPDTAWRALQAHDARFDGRLFVAVKTTGVYCRPVCRVRMPLRSNCRFYPNAASAERDGFRPCLRCRPERAPGLALVDSPGVLAQHAARLLDDAARSGDRGSVPRVAARLGIADRHLRRIFHAAHGVSPIEYMTTQRLLLARQLLTDTTLGVAQVALASGFGSVRHFNAAFAQRYGHTPRALRRDDAAAQHAGDGSALTLRLDFRPPYDVEGVLDFLARRCVAGIDEVDGPALRRTLAIEHDGKRLVGWLAMTFVADRNRVDVRIAPALASAAGAILQRVRQALDLDAEPALIEAVLASLGGKPGTRVPGAIDGFEAAVRIVLGQQVTLNAARRLAGRLVDRFGDRIQTPWPTLDRLFPSPRSLADASEDAIGSLGIVGQRARALQALARAVRDGTIELNRGASLAATLERLRALPGIGEWSVQMIAMRALAWPDAFPAADAGVRRALGEVDAAAIERRAQAWRPWRAYAAVRLWRRAEEKAT